MTSWLQWLLTTTFLLCVKTGQSLLYSGFMNLIYVRLLGLLGLGISLYYYYYYYYYYYSLKFWTVMSLRSGVLFTINIMCIHHSFISIQPWRPGLAGTRVRSCDRYGSGTLHPGQVLRGSLPLCSPAFRHSHFSHQVPPSATTREILAAKGGTVGEKDVR